MNRIIMHDSRFPIAGGSRDPRRGAFDNDPTLARPALVEHLRRSMGAANFATAIDLLNGYADSLLGLGEGESEGDPSAMDSRVSRGTTEIPGELAKMFPDAKAPMRV